MRNVIGAVGVVVLLGVGCSGQGQGPTAARGEALVSPAWASAAIPVGLVGHSATILPSGKVLVAGGWDGAAGHAEAVLYDPSDGQWTPTRPLPAPRYAHSAFLLPTGRVLVAGGWSGDAPTSDALLYDPVAGDWSATSPIPAGIGFATLLALSSGKVLALGGGDLNGYLQGTALYDPASGDWTTADPMPTVRWSSFAATALLDGRVLVAGGWDGVHDISSVDVFDPATGQWTPSDPLPVDVLTEPVRGTSGVLLPSGKVLAVSSTWAGQFLVSDAAVWDPATGRWAATGAPQQPRQSAGLVLLPTGEVALVGGNNVYGHLGSVERYDPAAGTWSYAEPLATARSQPQVLVAPTGRLLAMGGSGTSGTVSDVEVLDLASGAWSAALPPAAARGNHTATRLLTGEVLLVGGQDQAGQLVTAAERYDPSTGQWRAAGSLHEGRYYHSATLLSDGRVLVAGGIDAGFVARGSCELFDPLDGSWTLTGSLNVARRYQTSTLLPSGKVLVAGGRDTFGVELDVAELYDPATGRWTLTDALATARRHHSASLLHTGEVLVAGGYDGADGLASVERYSPQTDTWASSGPLAVPRDGHQATTLPSGAVLVTGGETYVGGTDLAAWERFAPTSGTWPASGSLQAARARHRATLLHSGKVLLSGGVFDQPADAELHDPLLGTWLAAGQMARPRSWAPATRLASGDVLVVGGSDAAGDVATAEIYREAAPVQPGGIPVVRAAPARATTGETITLQVTALDPLLVGPPLVRLRTSEDLEYFAAGLSFGAGEVRALIPERMVPGPAWLAVVAGGVASLERAIVIGVPPVVAAPVAPSAPPRGTVRLTAQGGRGEGFRWAVTASASGGVVDPASGVYTAGSVGGVTDVVQVVDPYGARDSVSVTVTAGVSITPSSKGVPSGATLRLAAAGGSGTGFTWTLQSNRSNASLTEGGVYVAGVVDGETDVVRVQDSLGNVATASLTVLPPLVISPAAVSLQARASRTFTASGGTGAGYRWSLATNASGGTIGETTGVYAAGPRGDVVDVVRLTDGDFSVTREVTVTPGAAPAATENPFQTSCGQGPAGTGSLLALGALLLLRRRARRRGVAAGLAALALAAATPALAQAPAQPARRPGKAVKVVVVPMQAGPGLEPALAEAMTGVVVAELTGRGIQVVTPKDVETALVVERQKQMLGCTAANCLTELAGAMGTDLIVSGGLSVVGRLKVVTVQLFNARSGAVQRNFQEQLANAEPEDLLDAAARAGQELFPETRSAAGPRRRTLLAAAPTRALAVELGGAYEPSGPGALGLLQLTWRLDAGVRLSAGGLLAGGGHPGVALRAAWVPFDRSRLSPYLAVQGVGLFAHDALFGAGAAIGLEWAISDRLSLSPELGALWLLSAPAAYRTSYLLPGVRLGWAL